MMRRYADAIRTFSHILLYVQRTKPLYQAKTYQNDQVEKKTLLNFGSSSHYKTSFSLDQQANWKDVRFALRLPRSPSSENRWIFASSSARETPCRTDCANAKRRTPSNSTFVSFNSDRFSNIMILWKEFENAFAFASPKFLSPVPPPVEAPPADHRREPFQQLAKVFMDEVQQQLTLPTIRR